MTPLPLLKLRDTNSTSLRNGEFYQTTRRQTPEDSTLHSHCRKNLNTNKADLYSKVLNYCTRGQFCGMEWLTAVCEVAISLTFLGALSIVLKHKFCIIVCTRIYEWISMLFGLSANSHYNRLSIVCYLSALFSFLDARLIVPGHKI
jgi:hypothetical protein